MFIADNVKYKWIVFLGAAFALVFTSFIGVFFGHLMTKFISPKNIKILAAAVFIIIGVFMLISVFREKPEESNKQIIKISNMIKEIEKIDKCRVCFKFNKFLEDNNEILKNEEINIVKENLNKTNACDNCNTEKLKNELLKITADKKEV